jgi:hypothetical protein
MKPEELPFRHLDETFELDMRVLKEACLVRRFFEQFMMHCLSHRLEELSPSELFLFFQKLHAFPFGFKVKKDMHEEEDYFRNDLGRGYCFDFEDIHNIKRLIDRAGKLGVSAGMSPYLEMIYESFKQWLRIYSNPIIEWSGASGVGGNKLGYIGMHSYSKLVIFSSMRQGKIKLRLPKKPFSNSADLVDKSLLLERGAVCTLTQADKTASPHGIHLKSQKVMRGKMSGDSDWVSRVLGPKYYSEVFGYAFFQINHHPVNIAYFSAEEMNSAPSLQLNTDHVLTSSPCYSFSDPFDLGMIYAKDTEEKKTEEKKRWRFFKK